jgi:hypothetical protein
LPLRDLRAERIARDLAAGKSVVIYGWELCSYIPELPRGHRFFRVEVSGVLTAVPVDEAMDES